MERSKLIEVLTKYRCDMAYSYDVGVHMTLLIEALKEEEEEEDDS